MIRGRGYDRGMASHASTNDLGSARPVGGEPVRAVERACAVLNAFSLEAPRLTLVDLAQRVSLPKPTAYRIASTLVMAGFMTQGEDGRYGLGPRVMELGAVVSQNLDVVRTCASAVDAVADATGETVILAEPDWETGEIMIVARHDSAHPLSVLSPVGRRSPIPPGAFGKALLSALPDDAQRSMLSRLRLKKLTPKTHTSRKDLLAELVLAQERGSAVEQEEFLEGVSAVAVPVLFDGTRPLATIGIVGPSSRLGAEELTKFGSILLELTRSL
jgi:DNA-binding IclR family transcriptional regulator